jgi:hypothetical protein
MCGERTSAWRQPRCLGGAVLDRSLAAVWAATAPPRIVLTAVPVQLAAQTSLNALTSSLTAASSSPGRATGSPASPRSRESVLVRRRRDSSLIWRS